MISIREFFGRITPSQWPSITVILVVTGIMGTANIWIITHARTEQAAPVVPPMHADAQVDIQFRGKPCRVSLDGFQGVSEPFQEFTGRFYSSMSYFVGKFEENH